MRVPQDVFQQYLAPDESVLFAGRGALVDETSERESSIGITDRRLLLASEDGGFVDVGLDSIHSIRSKPQTTFTEQGFRYRLLAVGGLLFSVGSFAAIAALTATLLAPALTVTFVGTGIGLAFVHRRPDLPVEKRVVTALEQFDAVELDRRELMAPSRQGRQLLLVGGGFLAPALFAALAVLTGGILAPLLAVGALVGLGLGEYAVRRVRDLDSIDASRKQYRDLRLHLRNGQTLQLRIDATEQIDQQLCKLTGASTKEVPDIELAPS